MWGWGHTCGAAPQHPGGGGLSVCTGAHVYVCAGTRGDAGMGTSSWGNAGVHTGMVRRRLGVHGVHVCVGLCALHTEERAQAGLHTRVCSRRVGVHVHGGTHTGQRGHGACAHRGHSQHPAAL